MTYIKTRCRPSGLLLFSALAGSLFATAVPAKPGPSVYADVQITFAGQTFGFGGVQESFSLQQSGGRIVFDLTMVGTPDYQPLPQIDTNTLAASGNNWEVVSKVGNRANTFVGTCGAMTFDTADASGLLVHHLYLNCSDLAVP